MHSGVLINQLPRVDWWPNPWFVALAHCHEASTPTMADIKLSVWYYWGRYEKRHRISHQLQHSTSQKPARWEWLKAYLKNEIPHRAGKEEEGRVENKGGKINVEQEKSSLLMSWEAKNRVRINSQRGGVETVLISLGYFICKIKSGNEGFADSEEVVVGVQYWIGSDSQSLKERWMWWDSWAVLGFHGYCGPRLCISTILWSHVDFSNTEQHKYRNTEIKQLHCSWVEILQENVEGGQEFREQENVRSNRLRCLGWRARTKIRAKGSF